MKSIPVKFPYKRRREIDGLRGLATTLVILGHLSQRFHNFYLSDMDLDPVCKIFSNIVCAAGSGVYLFFAISGYLIARSIGEVRQFGLSEHLKFYLYRAARIVPPYCVVLCLTWLALTLTGWIPQRTNQFQTHPESLTDSLLASLLCLHQILYGTFPRLFPPGWTIEVEVHFYALSPLLCIGLAVSVSRWGLGAASACILLGGGIVALTSLAFGIEWLQHTLPVFLPLFLLGIVAHAVEQRGWRPLSQSMPALGWPAFIAFATLQPWMSGLGMEIAVRMLLIAVMFGALASGRGAFFRLCTHPILTWAGVVSYSAYLVHMQITQAVFLAAESYTNYLDSIEMAAIAVASTIVLIIAGTTIFYFTIEKPINLLLLSFRTTMQHHVIRMPWPGSVRMVTRDR